VLVLESGVALAEAQPNAARADVVPGSSPEHAVGALPTVPKLELSLPPVQTRPVYQPEALRGTESPLGPAYWDAVQRLRTWRDAGDAELRLKIETASFQWGDFAVSAGITSVPERERPCAPSCAGAAWSSSVILRYPLSDAHPLRDVGPLRDVAPEIEVGTRPGAERRGSPGVVKAGVGGTF
jgi:hypothetical protein